MTSIDLNDNQLAGFVKNFFYASTDLPCLASLDGYLLKVSPGWSKTLGWREEELTSQPFMSFVHPDDKEITLKAMQNLNDGEEVTSFENRYRCKDGDYVWLSWNSLSDNENGIIFASARNITSYKHLIEDLTKKNKSLARFAYLASHDLREPLRKIQTFIDMLIMQRELCNPACENVSKIGLFVEKISKAAQRMQEMIDSLLKLSRIDTATVIIEEINLNDLLDEYLEDIPEKSNCIIQKLPAVKGSRVLLLELFANLIQNSIRYRDKTRLLAISIYALNNHTVVVEDNGLGFDSKYNEVIFEMFKRLYNKQEYEGTGIGLAICRQIMERHSGVIEAEGKVGVGAKFIITFPNN